MKPGYQTTEFWLTLAATLLSAIAASGIIPAQSPYAQLVGLISTTVLPVIYAYLRNQQKLSPTAPATLPEALALSQALGAGKTKDPMEGKP